MNTNGSKDLIRKPQKRISKRNKKGQGFFHNNHSFNFLNKNGGLQAHNYSEYVLQNPNTRSYNLKLHSGRPNSGYLKHIHSQSIRREKDHSGMGCYEEYTLRKIRTASDMIKQQLMSPEHEPITSRDINEESVDTSSLSKNKPLRLSSETPKISETNKEYLLTKPKRKSAKSSEEIARLQMKQKRKNELREKFKRDNISKQVSSETYNAKEISDLILKHISKMNNERIMDFLNSGDSRYGEAFNYICKQKSFEVTKALRDLSHQEKPEACEIVNAVIPDFSIKIEQLPINVIKELSLTFDELHKNIGNLSDENLCLFNRESDLQSSDDFSVFLQQICNDEMNDQNLKTEIQNDLILNTKDIIRNTDYCGNFLESIEVLDSEDEIASLEETDNTDVVPSHQIYSMEEVIHSNEKKCISSANQSTCLNTDIEEPVFTGTLPWEEEKEIVIHSTGPFSTQCSNSLNSLPNFNSLCVDENQTNKANDTDKIGEKTSNSTFMPFLDSVKVEVKPADNQMSLIPPDVTDSNLQPKVGSVWVSKNIFETSSGWDTPVEHEIIEHCSENFKNKENLSESSNNLSLPSEQQNSEPMMAEIDPQTLENITALQETDELHIVNAIVDGEISEPMPFSTENGSEIIEDNNQLPEENNTLCNPGVSYSPVFTRISPLTLKDSAQIATDVNNEKDKSKDKNLNENSTNILDTSDLKLDESSIISTINKDQNILAESSNVAGMDSIETPERIFFRENNHSGNDFVSLIIKPFDKPKNLKDAINFMTVIDKQIAILNKLRQDIFIGLSETFAESEKVCPLRKKRKLGESSESFKDSTNKSNEIEKEFEERSAQEISYNTKKTNDNEIQVEKRSLQQSISRTKIANEVLTGKKLVQQSNPSSEIFNGNEVHVEKKLVQKSNLNAKKSSPSNLQVEKKSVQELNTKVSSQKDVQVVETPIQKSNSKPFESLHCIKAVILFCKIIFEKNECIVGTDNGKIQYHCIYGNKPLMTVTIGNSAISLLECVRMNDWYYVFTGNSTELELKMLKYKRRFIEQKVHLEDSITAVRNEWGFFFIGGQRGYLTRYDWRKDRIQFEDRISQSCIKALTATREGPRKILVILFEDTDGVAHIHVRDAMTALHIRTIIDMKNVRSMYLRYSSVYLFTDEQISVYNCCDGNFVRKVTTQKPFSIVKSKGNLMVLVGTDGIYGYNMRTNKYLGCLKGEISASSVFIYEKMLLCGTWSKKIEVFDVPDHCSDILEYK